MYNVKNPSYIFSLQNCIQFIVHHSSRSSALCVSSCVPQLITLVCPRRAGASRSPTCSGPYTTANLQVSAVLQNAASVSVTHGLTPHHTSKHQLMHTDHASGLMVRVPEIVFSGCFMTTVSVPSWLQLYVHADEQLRPVSRLSLLVQRTLRARRNMWPASCRSRETLSVQC